MQTCQPLFFVLKFIVEYNAECSHTLLAAWKSCTYRPLFYFGVFLKRARRIDAGKTTETPCRDLAQSAVSHEF